MNQSRIEIHEFSTEIHEFSTGIHAERVGTGWVSRGFTGEYMNSTLDQIPGAVQRAIANRQFAVAEGASSDKPAVIGREILDKGEKWSVIAVVTKGRDDRGRSASMYRYFLCEGRDKLGNILAWIYDQPRFPAFDPYDVKTIGSQAVVYQNTDLDPITLPHDLQSLLGNPTPIIIDWNTDYHPLIVNKLARKIAGDKPLAWVLNVEALEQPKLFQVIQPASEKAERLLRRMAAVIPQDTVNISGEQSIKSAIKGLSSREQVKPEQILILEEALNNSEITQDYWESLFNSQGATQGRTLGIYSPQMVRLLTLQAILIPEMLPNYLFWMSKQGKQNDHYQVSENFQIEIGKALTQLSKHTPNLILINNLVEGVTRLIPSLLENPEQVEVTAWLLKLPNGLWSWSYSKVFIPNLKHYLISMPNFATRENKNLLFKLTSHDEWNKILEQISYFCKNPSASKLEYYKPLADLFEKLEDQPKLAALFSHIAYGKGEVPKRIFSQLESRDGWHSNVYGVWVERKVTFLDLLFLLLLKEFEIGGIDMRVGVALAILLVFTGLGFGTGLAVSSLANKSNINQQDLKKGVEEFDQTKKQIENIITKFPKNKQDLAKQNIVEILNPDLEYSSINTDDNKIKEDWVKAIYNYQKGPVIPKPNGIIDKDDETAKKIDEDLKNLMPK